MKVYTIERRQRVARPIDDVFAFFADAHNLDLLTPPWLRFQVRTSGPIEMRPGTQIEYTIRWRGFPLRWLTRIEEWTPGKQFVDVQMRGPYRLWHHSHCFEAVGCETVVEDVVRYALPFGILGRMVHTLAVGRDIERVFDYRAVQIARHFERADQPSVPMRVQTIRLSS